MVDDELAEGPDALDDTIAEELEQRERELFGDGGPRPRDGFSVLRLRAERLALETFAPLFVDLLGLIKADATHLCQQESGLLLDNVDRELADQVSRALEANGEECFVVSAADLLPLERPRPVINLRFTKSGLALGGATGDPTPLAWEEVAVLAASHVPVETTQKKASGNMLMANVSAGFAVGGVAGAVAMAALNPAGNARTVRSSAMHQFLDLVSGDGRLFFRVDARQFDYSILGEQLQAGSTANLLTLARWLVTYMPDLRTNLDAEQLKQTGTAPLAVHSPHGLLQVSQWLLNLARFGRQPLPPRATRQY